MGVAGDEQKGDSGEKIRREYEPEEGVDTNQLHAANELAAAPTKFKETVFEFTNSARRGCEEELYYNAMSGECMIKELVEAARKVEMETFRKHGVREKATIEECWEETGKGPVGVKLMDTSKGDKEKLEYRCRLVSKEIKKDRREDLRAATPPLEAKKLPCSPRASVPGMRLDFGDVVRAYVHARARRRGLRGAVKRGLGGGHVWAAEDGHAWDSRCGAYL